MELIRTRQLVQQELEKQTFDSCALLIGLGDREWTLTSPNVNPDTYFDAASLGKVFPTTTLALQACSRGLLHLDDRLDAFFPSVPDDKKAVTVRHLMTHTSGILRSAFPDTIADRGRDSILEFVLSRPCAFAPGTSYAYSCDAMLLLGFIVEKVFAMPLDEAFRRLLAEPLGMTRSKYNIAIDEPNAAVCYHHLQTPAHPWDDGNVTNMKGIPAGNGGNFCTAADLRIFVRALLDRDERLCSREYFDLAERCHTSHLTPWPDCLVYGNHGFGYEYVDDRLPQARVLFPEGSVGKEGWTGQSFYFNRDLRLYVILLTNAMRFTVKRLGRQDYREVCAMRERIHRAIGEDLGLICT